MQLFDECRDGLVLSKLINDSVPETIDVRVLNKPTAGKPLNNFKITENNNVVIASAKAIGCSVVNIGSSDLAEGREHLILGLIWQVIRRGLLAQVDIKLHPELYRLCEEGETIDDLLRLTPDQILLRWFNYHLKQAGWPKQCGIRVESMRIHPDRRHAQGQELQQGRQGRRELHRPTQPAQARRVLA
jgi:plastin-1